MQCKICNCSLNKNNKNDIKANECQWCRAEETKKRKSLKQKNFEKLEEERKYKI